MKRYFIMKTRTVKGGGLAAWSASARSFCALDLFRKTGTAASFISGARRLTCATGGIIGLMALLQVAHAQNPGGSAGGLVIGPQPSAQSSGLGFDILGIPTGNGAIASPEPDPDSNRMGPAVFVGTGQVVWEQDDLIVKGRDEVTNFVIHRRHLSRRNYPNSIFGPAWTFNYDHKLSRDSAGDVVMESFGRTDIFKRVGSTDVWEGQEGRFGRLTYVSATYFLRMAHGTILEFAADAADPAKPAHLKKITSPSGNTLVFTYKTGGSQLQRKLEKIVDAFGRMYEFFYEDGDYAAGVSRIRDFSGREVIYDYNAAGQLQSVRSPIINSTGGLNDFPGGKVHRYQYVNHTDPRLKNALKSVTYPNQATANIPRVQFTYDENAGTNPSNPFFGFLKTYTLGNPEAPTGLAAGGTYAYTYGQVSAADADLSKPFRRATVVDRSGTKTEYQVNRLGQILEEKILSSGERENSPASYVKSFKYNADGQMIEALAPMGGKTQYLYSYRRDLKASNNTFPNADNPRNVEYPMTDVVRLPDTRRADQSFIHTRTLYEPIFNKPFKTIDPRGMVQDGSGATNPTTKAKFTTTLYYDYMDDLSGAATVFAPLLGVEPAALTGGTALFAQRAITDQPGSVTRKLGQVIRVVHPQVTLPDSTTQQAVETFSYNGFGQLTRSVDAEENVTLYKYAGAGDPAGTIDLTNGGGYLKEVVADAELGAAGRNGQDPPPAAVMQTTKYEYTGQGIRGVATSMIDPKNVTYAYVVNELDQVVETISDQGGFGFRSRTFYDANDNPVETQVENKEASDFIRNVYTFDILDQKTMATLDVGHLGIATSFVYDADQNLVGRERGAHNPDTDPDHATEVVAYDERDIPMTTTLGGEEQEPVPARFENEVNGNGKATKNFDGEPSTQQAPALGDVSQTTYDGFDRVKSVIDPVGNRTDYTYDSASNVIKVERHGPVDHTATAHSLLARTERHYDERNREFRVDRHIFHYKGKEVGTVHPGAGSAGSGLVTSSTFYDRLGRLVATKDAEGDTTRFDYDGLSRGILTTDPRGNAVANTYDDNGNLTTVVETEVADVGSNPPAFSSQFSYDALNRQITAVDPISQTTTFGYDSRNNRIRRTDHLGNETEYVYDRLDRQVETRTYLSDSGLAATSSTKDSTAPVQSGDGIITTKTAYDDLHRIVSRTDDESNATVYEYDDLDRVIRTTYADGTEEVPTYNDDSELTGLVNPNKAVKTWTYDAKSRPTQLVISLTGDTGGTVGSTEKSWAYDGLGRLTQVTDNNGSGTGDDVTYAYLYDSLSRTIRETQTIGTQPALSVDTVWEGASRKIETVYPQGRRVARVYDVNDRMKTVSDVAGQSLLQIARFDYVGPARDQRIQYGNNAQLNPTYDGNRRPTRYEWKKDLGAGVPITSYVNTYNGTNRRVSEKREHLNNHTDTYTFDSDYRMIGFTPDYGAGSSRVLDGTDKMSTTFTDKGGSRAIVLTPASPETVMNQYNEFEDEGQIARDYQYDDSSNLDDDGDFKYIQDHQNRIVEIRNASDDSLVAKYTYDAGSRRVMRDVGGTMTRYLYDGWQVLEERDGANEVLRQYVDGRGIDEHLQMRDFSSGSARDFYFHCNSQGFVGALSDDSGDAVEFYEYSFLGEPTIFAEDKTTTRTVSQFGNPYYFQGRRLDPETRTSNGSSVGLYYYRNRYYNPDTGQFMTIDPLGNWQHGQGNGFSAFGADGWNMGDPLGLNLLEKEGEATMAFVRSKHKVTKKLTHLKLWARPQRLGGVSREQRLKAKRRAVDVREFLSEVESESTVYKRAMQMSEGLEDTSTALTATSYILLASGSGAAAAPAVKIAAQAAKIGSGAAEMGAGLAIPRRNSVTGRHLAAKTYHMSRGAANIFDASLGMVSGLDPAGVVGALGGVLNEEAGFGNFWGEGTASGTKGSSVAGTSFGFSELVVRVPDAERRLVEAVDTWRTLQSAEDDPALGLFQDVGPEEPVYEGPGLLYGTKIQ